MQFVVGMQFKILVFKFVDFYTVTSMKKPLNDAHALVARVENEEDSYTELTYYSYSSEPIATVYMID